jgi:hypothetical protein
MVEAGKDPTEHAKTRLLAPTVRIAVACHESGRLSGATDECENDVAKNERQSKPLHPVRLALGYCSLRGGVPRHARARSEVGGLVGRTGGVAPRCEHQEYRETSIST